MQKYTVKRGLGPDDATPRGAARALKGAASGIPRKSYQDRLRYPTNRLGPWNCTLLNALAMGTIGTYSVPPSSTDNREQTGKGDKPNLASQYSHDRFSSCMLWSPLSARRSPTMSLFTRTNLALSIARKASHFDAWKRWRFVVFLSNVWAPG